MAARPAATPPGASSVTASYFLFGEDGFRARRYVRDLGAALAGPDGQPATVKTFLLGDTGWRDILDEARTIPFFFSPWQILVAEGSGTGDQELTDVEKDILKEYFRSPTPKTVLVVLFEEKILKTKALYRLFDRLPETAAEVIEFTPLKAAELTAWAAERFRALGKTATDSAIGILLEATGNDTGRLENEIEKLALFVGSRPRIEEADASLLTTGEKDFERWALSDSLERGDVRECLRIVRQRFLESDKAELMLLGQLQAFFRDLLTAQTELGEGKDRAEVFRGLRPWVQERFSFYRDKYAALFGAVDSLRPLDLSRLIGRLSEIDAKAKTTESSPRSMLEALIVEYGEIRRGRRITSSGRR